MGRKVIVCGAGEVGTHIATYLADGEHDVTIVDANPSLVRSLAETVDVSAYAGNCASAEVLHEAGAATADLVVACTSQDEVNLLTATIAKRLGAKKTVARIEHRIFYESGIFNYSSELGIDGIICPDYSTAQAIARVLRNPGSLAVEDFGQHQIEMQEFTVSQGAVALGRPLKDVKLPPGTILAAVKRGNSALVPDGNTVIQVGDTVVLAANNDVCQQARRQFEVLDHQHRQVVLMSGSPIAVWLCRALRHHHLSIRLFEPDRERAIELGNKLDWVTVIQEDVVDQTVFDEERVGQADVFVACGDDDDQNILSCVWAKSKGTGTVIAVSGRLDYIPLLKRIGVDHAFSPRTEAADEIKNFLSHSPIDRLASLAKGEIDVYRVPVGDDSGIVGRAIADIGRSSNWIIAVIRRGDTAFVPTARHHIATGDTLVIVGSKGLERTFSRLFDATRD